MIVTLNAAEIAILQRAVNGEGGLQSFGRKLQAKLDMQTGEIQLTDAELGRVIRYMSYGPGGFEGRLQQAFLRSISAMIARA